MHGGMWVCGLRDADARSDARQVHVSGGHVNYRMRTHAIPDGMVSSHVAHKAFRGDHVRASDVASSAVRSKVKLRRAHHIVRVVTGRRLST